jgi:hypothetical protein
MLTVMARSLRRTEDDALLREGVGQIFSVLPAAWF